MTGRFARWAWWGAGVFAAFVSTEAARACSVCFGDPESPMAKGALAGVAVLGGVVACVLMGIGCTGLFWLHRGRRLGHPDCADGVSSFKAGKTNDDRERRR